MSPTIDPADVDAIVAVLGTEITIYRGHIHPGPDDTPYWTGTAKEYWDAYPDMSFADMEAWITKMSGKTIHRTQLDGMFTVVFHNPHKEPSDG